MTELSRLERTIATAVASHLIFAKPETLGDLRVLCHDITATVLQELLSNNYSIHYCGEQGYEK